MLTVIALAMCFFATLAHADSDAVNRFSAVDAALLVDSERAVLLDVREHDARSLGFVDGDVHAPASSVGDSFAHLPPGKIYITYCACEKEESSLAVAEALLDRGYTRVGVLVGGVDAWRELDRGDIIAERSEMELMGVHLPPRGWMKTDRDPKHYIFEPRDGALVIRGVGADAERKTAAMQRIDAADVRGATVAFEVDLTLYDVPFGVSIWLRAEDSDGEMVAYQGLEPGPWTGSRTTERARVSLAVPDTAVELDFGVVLRGMGTIVVDRGALTTESADGAARTVDGAVNLGFD